MAKDATKPTEAKEKAKPEKKPSCFIIMPITVPDSRLADYGGDANHFKRVLDHLFVPAVEAAEYKPIRPDAKGDENIPARIIKNLETADMVLCDMSMWNANVLFELGVRTALNKPACLVKDDLTEGLPFDTATINCQSYRGTISSWDLAAMNEQVQQLTDHIVDAATTSSGENSLWKYYGIRSVGAPAEKGGLNDQIDLILRHVEQLRKDEAPAIALIERDLRRLLDNVTLGAKYDIEGKCCVYVNRGLAIQENDVLRKIFSAYPGVAYYTRLAYG